MSKSITQVNYDELQRISKSLHNESEEIVRLHSTTRQKVEALRGGWTGEAANAFFREQEGQLLPAVLKVSRALGDSETVLNQIMQIIRAADEETAGYFKGFEAGSGIRPSLPWDWKKFVDGILGLPFDEMGKAFKGMPIISLIWGIYQDRSEGEDWGRAIFSELAELGIDIGVTALFPPYIIYPVVIAWLHVVSAESKLFGRDILPTTALSEGIFEIAKFFDRSLTEADQAGWFQDAAEWLDIREEIGDGFYNTLTYVDEHRIGPFIYIDVGPGTPFPSFSRSTPVAL